MTVIGQRPGSTSPTRLPRVVLIDRGDPLVGPLSTAMRQRFDVIEQVDVELSHLERLVVAGATFRPTPRVWSERFHKSNLAVTRRSRRARSALRDTAGAADVVFQTHGLFETCDARTVMYVDCTHQQSMAQWPAWNPLRGRALESWLARERRQFNRAAHVFAFSQETAHSLVEQYGVPRDRVSVVGAGVNFEHLPAVGRGHDGPPTVLFVGNDFERKGGPRLLEAFAILRERVPDARLRIVGAPYPVPTGAGVEHLGRVESRDTMSQLFREADVFCLPAHFDPFPGVLLEAMAHGLPCVVTPTCGIPEIILDGVTALTVEHGETVVADLAAALERLLLDTQEAEQMGRLGRRRVEERFLWSHVVERMAPVLERLTDPRPLPDPTPTPPTLSTLSTPPTTTNPGERP